MIGTLGKPNLGNVGIKMKRNDIDYTMEKDWKERKKRSKAWRQLRQNQINAKRYHDRINQDDGRILANSNKEEGWDFVDSEGWDD